MYWFQCFLVHCTSKKQVWFSSALTELDQVREWSEQFTEKYPIVGKLLKPDETPTVYTDDEADIDEKEIEAENKAIVGGRPS